MVPLSSIGFISPVNANPILISEQKDVKPNTEPATRADTFLYRQIGVNFLCRARMADVEFPKALGISSATFADIVAQKHGGFVAELPDKQLTPKQIYLSAEIQIIEGALKFCADQVPEESKKQFEEFLKKESKDKKAKKRK